MKNLRAVLALLLLALNLGLWIVPVTLLALLRLVCPLAGLRRLIRCCMEWLAVAAISGDTLVWRFVSGVRIEWVGEPPPRLRDNCIVIANHQSWSDILLLQHALIRRTAPLKWLAKRELLYVPVIGLICWAYGYPMLNRYPAEQLAANPGLRERDARQVQRACASLQSQPGTIMNFPEGTRHTAAKASRVESPYQYLLPPRVGGMHQLVQVLGSNLVGILDITIQYPQAPARFWDFLAGRYPCVRMHCEYIPAGELAFLHAGTDSRAVLRAWLDERWSRKDRLLDGYLSP